MTDYSAVAICALGCRDADGDRLAPLAKVRLPKEELIEVRSETQPANANETERSFARE